jgi:uncharacterized protein (TIGR02147 family)
MPNIFQYNDYRKFLEDYQAAAHENTPSFSHRNFALKAGFSSTGLLSNIMKGRRNLTDALISKFAQALKLNKKEELYFEHLVHFNQALTIDDKNKYYSRMLQVLPLKAKTVPQERHVFYSKWWYSAIRELLYYYKFSDDYRSLARCLDPPIPIELAREAIATLEESGMIEKDENGYYRQTDTIITTGALSERSLNVENFQLATIDLARESLQHHKREIRDISTLTLTLSPVSIEKVKNEIALLQKKLLSIAEEDQNVNSVYQINFQMFPLTKTGNTQ